MSSKIPDWPAVIVTTTAPFAPFILPVNAETLAILANDGIIS